VIELLDAPSIASGNLNTVTDLIAHPQLAARWGEVDSPAGVAALACGACGRACRGSLAAARACGPLRRWFGHRVRVLITGVIFF